MIRPRNRAIRRAYLEGVIDFTESDASSRGATSGVSYAADIDRARRQGWFDARAKRVLRYYEFSVDEVMRRVEVREAGR